MVEDKLSRQERVRVEALTQAVAASVGTMLPSHEIVERAKVFESYIWTGE